MTTQDEKTILVWEWREAKRNLDYWKAKELELRNKTVEICFGENAVASGTQYAGINDTESVKAVFKVSYKLDEKRLENVLVRMEKAGPEGKLLAERIIRWKPELDKKEYDKLPEKFRKLFDEVVTVVPGQPSLEISQNK